MKKSECECMEYRIQSLLELVRNAIDLSLHYWLHLYINSSINSNRKILETGASMAAVAFVWFEC